MHCSRQIYFEFLRIFLEKIYRTRCMHLNWKIFWNEKTLSRLLTMFTQFSKSRRKCSLFSDIYFCNDEPHGIQDEFTLLIKLDWLKGAVFLWHMDEIWKMLGFSIWGRKAKNTYWRWSVQVHPGVNATWQCLFRNWRRVIYKKAGVCWLLPCRGKVTFELHLTENFSTFRKDGADDWRKMGRLVFNIIFTRAWPLVQSGFTQFRKSKIHL